MQIMLEFLIREFQTNVKPRSLAIHNYASFVDFTILLTGMYCISLTPSDLRWKNHSDGRRIFRNWSLRAKMIRPRMVRANR
jgi:hypothetical protein